MPSHLSLPLRSNMARLVPSRTSLESRMAKADDGLDGSVRSRSGGANLPTPPKYSTRVFFSTAATSRRGLHGARLDQSSSRSDELFRPYNCMSADVVPSRDCSCLGGRRRVSEAATRAWLNSAGTDRRVHPCLSYRTVNQAAGNASETRPDCPEANQKRSHDDARNLDQEGCPG